MTTLLLPSYTYKLLGGSACHSEASLPSRQEHVALLPPTAQPVPTMLTPQQLCTFNISYDQQQPTASLMRLPVSISASSVEVASASSSACAPVSSSPLTTIIDSADIADLAAIISSCTLLAIAGDNCTYRCDCSKARAPPSNTVCSLTQLQPMATAVI